MILTKANINAEIKIESTAEYKNEILLFNITKIIE